MCSPSISKPSINFARSPEAASAFLLGYGANFLRGGRGPKQIVRKFQKTTDMSDGAALCALEKEAMGGSFLGRLRGSAPSTHILVLAPTTIDDAKPRNRKPNRGKRGRMSRSSKDGPTTPTKPA
jgi:hypothetical protein